MGPPGRAGKRGLPVGYLFKDLYYMKYTYKKIKYRSQDETEWHSACFLYRVILTLQIFLEVKFKFKIHKLKLLNFSNFGHNC